MCRGRLSVDKVEMWCIRLFLCSFGRRLALVMSRFAPRWESPESWENAVGHGVRGGPHGLELWRYKVVVVQSSWFRRGLGDLSWRHVELWVRTLTWTRVQPSEE